MSGMVRRTIDMPFSPVCIAQADDPARAATIGINANQHSASDLTNGYHPTLAIIPPIVDLFDRETPEQFDCQPEWQSALDEVSLALGLVPHEIHGTIRQRQTYVKDRRVNRARGQTRSCDSWEGKCYLRDCLPTLASNPLTCA
jgi:hypothetical protein